MALTDVELIAQRIRECDDAYSGLLGRPLVAYPKDYWGIANGVIRRVTQGEDAVAFEEWIKSTDEYRQRHPPTPPAPPRPPLSAPIQANFCGATAPWGEPIFDIWLATWAASTRQAIYTIKRAAGLTDIALSVEARNGYHGAHAFDWSREPGQVVALVQEVQAAGFNVELFLSSGDGETGETIDEYFPTILQALSAVDPIRIVPAWEPVVGGWTSAQLSHAMQVIHQLAPQHELWVHLSPTRACGSSHPIEPDDPWQGDEAGFWRSHGGEFATGLLYETEHGGPLLYPANFPNQSPDDPNYAKYPGYLGRLYEIAIRALVGGRGWRQTRVCVWETGAMDFFNLGCTGTDLRRIKAQCQALGYTEFGNCDVNG